MNEIDTLAVCINNLEVRLTNLENKPAPLFAIEDHYQLNQWLENLTSRVQDLERTVRTLSVSIEDIERKVR